MTMLDAMRRDLRDMDEICCMIGQSVTDPDVPDTIRYLAKCVYLNSVALHHLLESEIKRKESAGP